MDKQEAKAILVKQIARLREQSYTQLQGLIRDQQHIEVTGPSGQWYQIEFQAFWDDKSERNLRVIARIDDGGLRAIVPLSEDFIVAPDGAFVGE